MRVSIHLQGGLKIAGTGMKPFETVQIVAFFRLKGWEVIMRVLVVDDQRQMREILRKMLLQMRLFQSVDDAEDGERAWERLDSEKEANPYKLVVADVIMPRLSGLELLKRIRKQDSYRHTPFVMISGESGRPTITSALGELGADDFIIKPFSFDIINQRIRGVLKRAQSPEEHLFHEAEKLMEGGDVDDSLKLIGQWERENSTTRARWLNLRGECLEKMGDSAKAAIEFEKAMAASNLFLKAHKNYADAHLKLGQTGKAIAALKYIDDACLPDNERSFQLGRLMIQNGQEEEGKNKLQAAIKRTSGQDREKTLKKAAQIYLEAGLFKEAEAAYAVNVSLNPSDPSGYSLLGVVLRQQGKLDEAEQIYLKALRGHPRHAGLYYNLGVLYMAKQDDGKARKCLKKALVFAPDFKEAEAMLQKVDKLFPLSAEREPE